MSRLRGVCTTQFKTMSATVSSVERRVSESEKVSAQLENPTQVGAETPFQSTKLIPPATSMGPNANKKNSRAAGSSIRTVAGLRRCAMCLTPPSSLRSWPRRSPSGLTPVAPSAPG